MFNNDLYFIYNKGNIKLKTEISENNFKTKVLILSLMQAYFLIMSTNPW